MVDLGGSKTQFLWDKKFLDYDFGKNHPLNPLRLQLTVRLLEDLDFFAAKNVQIVSTVMASFSQLLQVHDANYLRAVENPSLVAKKDLVHFGLGTVDTPLFPNMHLASSVLVGASLQGAEAIISGKCLRAINLGGGMHHARSNKANGFCVYNDVAVAILALLHGGMRKVLYVDLDGHHGDGVETFFWNNPQVLTVSLHETGKTLFPGTGSIQDVGGSKALGSAVNVPLLAGTNDAQWLRAFHSVVVPLVEAFEPDIIVSQHGCDGHFADPLTNLSLTVDGQREAMLTLRDLVEQFCAGRWLALGGGGYNISNVVPRVWAHLCGVVANADIALNLPVPQVWQDYAKKVATKFGIVPQIMGDGANIWWRSWESGYDQETEIDQIILAVRKQVFPFHGLDPWFS